MAKILTIIEKTKGEQLLDIIAQILAIELKNQAVLIADQRLDATIWTNRFIPFDRVELPAVNISLLSDEFSNKTNKTQDSVYTYTIDVYVRGDNELDAVYAKNRISGLIRGILDNPIYKLLGQNAPIVRTTIVRSIKSNDAQSEVNNDYISMRQIDFEVHTWENTQGIEAPMLALSSTVVKIGESEKGYRWEQVSDGVGLEIEPSDLPIIPEVGGLPLIPESGVFRKKLSQTTEIIPSDISSDVYVPLFIGGVENYKIKASYLVGGSLIISDFSKVVNATTAIFQDDLLKGVQIFGMIFIDKVPYDAADGIVFDSLLGTLDFSSTINGQIFDGQKIVFTTFK